jgi:hypothetical protein
MATTYLDNQLRELARDSFAVAGAPKAAEAKLPFDGVLDDATCLHCGSFKSDLRECDGCGARFCDCALESGGCRSALDELFCGECREDEGGHRAGFDGCGECSGDF